MKLNIPIINKTLLLSFALFRTPTNRTAGISSRCKDGKHILFFDYDNLPIDDIYFEIKHLQRKYKLSTAYFFSLGRSNSYHVIILDKFYGLKAKEILSNTNIDHDYIDSINRPGREWVLRCSEKGKRKKPKYCFHLLSSYFRHETSRAHRLFLEKYYGIPSIKYHKEDTITEIPIVNYSTGNRV